MTVMSTHHFSSGFTFAKAFAQLDAWAHGQADSGIGLRNPRRDIDTVIPVISMPASVAVNGRNETFLSSAVK